MKILYFDSAATTAVYPELNETIALYNSELYFNASALYSQATAATSALNEARGQVAKVLGVEKDTLTFTSGATESNNWVLRSVCTRPLHNEIVITEGEHPSVRETAAALSAKGVTVKTAPLTRSGKVNHEKLMGLLSDKTDLVSLIHVSNETGAINDIASLAEEIKAQYPNIKVHSDGVQAFGKFRTKLKNIDYYSISAHKIHGTKGVGAVYISKNCRPVPLLTGGGQERSRRSGTENVAAIAAFGLAAEKYAATYSSVAVNGYRAKVLEILSTKEGFFNNLEDSDGASAHIISCGFCGIRGETLLHALSAKGIIIGRGSACSSRATGNSVLSAIGISSDRILSSVRLSFDMNLTEQEINYFCKTVLITVDELRGKLL